MSLALVGLVGLLARADPFAAGNCNLCHQVPEQATAARQDSCSGCHAWIQQVAADPERRQAAQAVFPLWSQYEARVVSYLQVPSLEAGMARLSPGWVRAWLSDPHDVRPGLPEAMPRFGLDPAQLDALETAFSAALVSVPATPPPSAERVARGAQLYDEKGCASCHSLGQQIGSPGLAMAPDLAHTRQRMGPDMVAAWIQDPQGVSPQATMPSLGLNAEEALALRDYILLKPLQAPPQSALSTTVAPAEQAVGWAEVNDRVFGRVCVHCHMDPDQNGGRAGPGNGGGFGYAPTGIELQTLAGVRAAAHLIPDALARRRLEVARDVVRPGHAPATVQRPERPGMPLGLPAISDEDTALVLAWLAQGAPD